MKKIAIAAILCLLLATALPSASVAQTLGPYTGKVLDKTTGAPVEGASVLVYWQKKITVLMGSYSELIGAALVYTDKNGRYVVPAIEADMGLTASLEPEVAVIYEPGYVAYVGGWHSWQNEHEVRFQQSNNVVELERVPPGFNHRAHYDRIRHALEGMTLYLGSPEGGLTWERLIEYKLKGIDAAALLRRAEWEERIGRREGR